MKAQSSLELLIVIALTLGFVGVSFYVASTYSSDSVKISQAQDAAGRLAAAADYVYSLGPNSREYVTVFLPDDIRYMNATGKRILLTIGTSGGTSDVAESTKAELIGSLPSGRGRQKVLVQYLASGKVLIGEAGISCSPYSINLAFDAGTGGSQMVSITNNADFQINGINASISGAAAQLSSPSVPQPSLDVGANSSFSVNFAIPAGQASGIYSSLLMVSTSNDGACVVELDIQVRGQSSCSSLCNSGGYAYGTCRASSSSCMANNEDSVSQYDSGCNASGPTPSCCCFPTGDSLGPIVSSASHAPANATSTDNITIYSTCNDTLTGGSFISAAYVQVDGASIIPMNATDGAFSDEVADYAQASVGRLAAGSHVATLSCKDIRNNTGPSYYYYFNVTQADVIGPIITYLNHSNAFPTTLANITENGTGSDEFTGNSNVAGCYVRLDAGNWINATPSDGAYDSPLEQFTYNIGKLSTGIHTVYAYCVDSRGNIGGIYNDTFGVSAADIMIVLDRSGSMSEGVVYNANNNQVTTSSSSFTLVKSLAINQINSNGTVSISTEIRAGSSGCTASFEARVGGAVIASGSRNSTSYGTIINSTSFANFTAPFTIGLYLKRDTSGCTAYNRNFRVSQLPTKMNSSQVAANLFVDLMDASSQAGLASYSTSSTIDRPMLTMNSSANIAALKSAISSLSPSGNTCIQCGLDSGVSELTGAASRYPEAVRVMVLLTDGQGNVGDSVAGAVNARNNNVIVYAIGYGADVDATELTNIALLTYGKYYYAPDAATLAYIYQHIGQ